MNPQSRVLVGQNIGKLYGDIFETINPTIKFQKKGVLSTVIYTILESDKSQAQKICEYLKIEDYASLEDDLSILIDIADIFISNPNDKKLLTNDIIVQFKDFGKNAHKKIINKVESNDMKLFQIVVIGCLIVGAVSCVIYLNKKQEEEKKKNQNLPPDNSPQRPKDPVPVALCILVPASVVRNLGNIKKDTPINISNIEILIENASYFLCTSPEVADTIQQPLKLTNENITDVSEQREFYVRINIPDGEEMMDKKVPYILKRNLPSNGQCMVEKLACLEYLSVSGLENFNRV
jgi:hypothetical protein